MQKLQLIRQPKTESTIKAANIYADTHEKLTLISKESGIPMVQLIRIMVDFASENMEIIEPLQISGSREA